jgi:uncharacterized membrane protein
MEPTEEALGCPACRTIDRADGVEDGKLYPVIASHVKDENRIMRGLRSAQDKAADKITSFTGSMSFIYIHTGWFGLWLFVNLGALGVALKFDKYPFGLLTMIVSLEAIFLSTFVMITQNRQAARSDVRSQIDFENNVRSEIWSVHVGQALGIDAEHVERMIKAAMAGYRKEGAAS